jgi:hypothetical protein
MLPLHLDGLRRGLARYISYLLISIYKAVTPPFGGVIHGLTMARLEGTCVYCGAFGTIHMDHVPPKNLFEAQAQSQLLTVPACRSCNNSASKDDEYFLVVMALRSDATLRPEHPNLWQKALRLLRRDRAAGDALRFTAFLPLILKAGNILMTTIPPILRNV